MDNEQATFAAGCFWQVEEAFRKAKGVVAARVGYSGGREENPSYEKVCTGNTGHAEAVEVTYNPAIISYEKLLDIFWNLHDPTQINRQGPDVGDQYRSAIFYHNEKQKDSAEASKKKLEERQKYSKKIATLILPVERFFEAEEYHQRYLEKQKKKDFWSL